MFVSVRLAVFQAYWTKNTPTPAFALCLVCEIVLVLWINPHVSVSVYLTCVQWLGFCACIGLLLIAYVFMVVVIVLLACSEQAYIKHIRQTWDHLLICTLCPPESHVAKWWNRYMLPSCSHFHFLMPSQLNSIKVHVYLNY